MKRGAPEEWIHLETIALPPLQAKILEYRLG